MVELTWRGIRRCIVDASRMRLEGEIESGDCARMVVVRIVEEDNKSQKRCNFERECPSDETDESLGATGVSNNCEVISRSAPRKTDRRCVEIGEDGLLGHKNSDGKPVIELA